MPVNDGDRDVVTDEYGMTYDKQWVEVARRASEELENTLHPYEIGVIAQIIAEEREKHQSELQEQHEAMAACIESNQLWKLASWSSNEDYLAALLGQYGLSDDERMSPDWLTKAAERYNARQKEKLDG